MKVLKLFPDYARSSAAMRRIHGIEGPKHSILIIAPIGKTFDWIFERVLEIGKQDEPSDLEPEAIAKALQELTHQGLLTCDNGGGRKRWSMTGKGYDTI